LPQAQKGKRFSDHLDVRIELAVPSLNRPPPIAPEHYRGPLRAKLSRQRQGFNSSNAFVLLAGGG